MGLRALWALVGNKTSFRANLVLDRQFHRALLITVSNFLSCTRKLDGVVFVIPHQVARLAPVDQLTVDFYGA